jgi:predicted metal-binding membrane protein
VSGLSPAVAGTAGRSAPRSEGGRNGLRQGQLAVLAALLALAAVAWLVSDLRMASMDAGPGTDPGAFSFYISTWVVMMAAMMFPSIGPMVLTFRGLQRGRSLGRRAEAESVGLFVIGYLLVWTASGLLAYGALKAGRAADIGWLGWHRGGRWLVAGLLGLAALYEVTPWKNACLIRCRSPLGFLVSRWRDGRTGAFRMGTEHGAWCLGCCWLLMVVLFALGAMSLTWMIVVTLLISAEKLLPRRVPGIALVAAVLGVLAAGIAAAPGDVPGLTIPGSPAAMRAMQAMGGSKMGDSKMGGAMSSAPRRPMTSMR